MTWSGLDQPPLAHATAAPFRATAMQKSADGHAIEEYPFTGSGIASGVDHLLPSKATDSPPAVMARQNWPVGQETYSNDVAARSPPRTDHCMPSNTATVPLGPTETQKCGDAHETSVSLIAVDPPPMATGIDHERPLNWLAIPPLLTAAQKVAVGQETDTNSVDDSIGPWLDQDRPLNRSASPDAVRAFRA